MEQMAVRLHGPGDVRVEPIAVVQPVDGEVLVRVRAAGVCRSDVALADGTLRTAVTPIVLGHELAGIVASAAGAAHDLVGAPVVALAGRSCGSCPRCLADRPGLCDRLVVPGVDVDGALAEFAVVPATELVPLPDELPFPVAATAPDAAATAYHALECRGRVDAGRSVLVVGVGGVGGYAVQLARAFGAAPIVAVDRDPMALERARALGADEAILADEDDSARSALVRAVRTLTGGGVDVAVDTAGGPGTLSLAAAALGPGGRAVAVGLHPDPTVIGSPLRWAAGEHELLGAFGAHRRDVTAVLRMLAEGALVAPFIETTDLADVPTRLLAGDLPSAGRLVATP